MSNVVKFFKLSSDLFKFWKPSARVGVQPRNASIPSFRCLHAAARRSRVNAIVILFEAMGTR